MGVAPGTYTLIVRKVGFGGAETVLTLMAGQVLGADLELTGAVPQLKRVDVTAAATSVAGPLAEIAASARRTGATFIERSTIDSAYALGRSLTTVLETYAHRAQLVKYQRTGAVLVSSGRGLPSPMTVPRADPDNPKSQKACYAQVIVDGAQRAPDHSATAVPDLREYELNGIEAMAFYPGPATTPAAYDGTGASCGTLLIWTRR